MVTKLGAVLAGMPMLKHLSMYLPYGGDEDWYCTWAPIEAQLLLAEHHIETVSFVFLGEKAAEALRKYRSQECYKALMGAKNESLAMHECNTKYQLPQGYRDDLRAVIRKKWRKQDHYVKDNAADTRFWWDWGDRNIDMCDDGNVQAVITFWNRDDAEGQGEVANGLMEEDKNQQYWQQAMLKK